MRITLAERLLDAAKVIRLSKGELGKYDGNKNAFILCPELSELEISRFALALRFEQTRMAVRFRAIMEEWDAKQIIASVN